MRFSPFSPFPFFFILPHTRSFNFFPQEPFPHHHSILQNIYPWNSDQQSCLQDEASIAINLLTRVSGIGPAKARDLYDEGIRDLDQLRKHAFRNELYTNSARFKLNHHQLIGLKHFEDFERRIPRDEITEILAKLEKCVGEFDKEYKLTVCGSYRQGVLYKVCTRRYRLNSWFNVIKLLQAMISKSAVLPTFFLSPSYRQ